MAKMKLPKQAVAQIDNRIRKLKKIVADRTAELKGLEKTRRNVVAIKLK